MIHSFDTTSTAILSADLMFDLARISEGQGEVAPADVYALSAVGEAALLHEYLVTPWHYQFPLSDIALIKPLVDENVLDGGGTRKIQDELNDVGGEGEGDNFLLDLTWDHFLHPTDAVGFQAMMELVLKAQSEWIGLQLLTSSYEAQNDDILEFLGNLAGFAPADVRWLDGVNRHVRALATAGFGLGVDLYTGLLHRPLLLARWKKQRDISGKLFDRLVAEFDDELDLLPPGWGQIEIPLMAQLALGRCRGDLSALPYELLELRNEHQEFRITMADYRRSWLSSTTRLERRQLTREVDAALTGLTRREITDSASTGRRLLHRVLAFIGNPGLGTAFKEISAEAVEQADLSMLNNRIAGLSALRTEIGHSPPSDHGARLMVNAFGAEPDPKVWGRISRLMSELELALTSQPDGRSEWSS